jgi:hypothetical protein
MVSLVCLFLEGEAEQSYGAPPTFPLRAAAAESRSDGVLAFPLRCPPRQRLSYESDARAGRHKHCAQSATTHHPHHTALYTLNLSITLRTRSPSTLA